MASMGVADGVAEIQNGAQAGLMFILSDNLRLDFATAGDDLRKQRRVATQQFRQGGVRGARKTERHK